MFTLFVSWGGTNAWSRYSLTAAMAENQSFDISAYAHTTRDKAIEEEALHFYMDELTDERSLNRSQVFQNQSLWHELNRRIFEEGSKKPRFAVYSDKPPLSSLVAVPGYIAGGLLSPDPDRDRWLNQFMTDTPLQLSTTTALRQFFMVFLASVLPGTALLVLLYRDLGRYVQENIALYTTVIAGLATPVFFYSSKFLGVITAAFLGFASYLVMVESLHRGKSRYMALAGLLSALAVSTEYYAAVIPGALFFYILSEGYERSAAWFAGGTLLGVVPLMLYHWTVTGNPFDPVILNSGVYMPPGPIETLCTVYQACGSGVVRPFGIVFDPLRTLNAAFRLLFFESRGLFFYSPILLLSIPGIYEIYKRKKTLLFVSPGIFVLSLLFEASHMNWLAGISFGPRYAIVGLPFLVLPLALGLRKMMRKGRTYQVFVLLVFLFSAFNMLLGFNALQGDIDGDTYTENFHSLAAVQPGFQDHLIEEFKKYGARSEILMGFLGRFKGFDIIYRAPYGPEFVEIGVWRNSGVLLWTNLLPVMLSIGLFLIFFRDRFRWLSIAGILLLVLMAAFSIKVSDSYILGDQYRYYDQYSASAGQGFQAVFHPEEGEIPYLEAAVYSPLNITSQKLSVDVDGKKHFYHVDGFEQLYFPFTGSGRVNMELKTERCIVPAMVTESTNPECLSVFVRNMSLIDSRRLEGSLLIRGWHSLGKLGNGSWMPRKAVSALKVRETDGLLELNISQHGRLVENNLTVRLNGREVTTLDTHVDGSVYLPSPRQGWNKIELESSDCIVPARRTDRRDRRCLSYRLEDLSYLDLSQVNNALFVSGFHSLGKRNGSWLKREGKILKKMNGTEDLLRISVDRIAHLQNSTLEVHLNGRQLDTLRKEGDFYIPVDPEKGLNELVLKADSCVVPSRVSGSSDDRCLSYRVENISVVEQEAVKQPLLTSGFYSGSEEGFWIEERGMVMFRAEESSVIEFSAEKTGYLDNSSLRLILDGRHVKTVKASGKVYLRVEGSEKWRKLVLEPDSCVVPSRVSGSSDDRCLSYRVENISVTAGQNIRGFKKLEGWYGKEPWGVWMRERAAMLLHSGSTLLNLTLRPQAAIDESEISVRVDGDRSRTLEVSSGLESYLIYTGNPGIKLLTLESNTGCVVPAQVIGSGDQRCLSYLVKEVKPVQDIDERKFGGGWYPDEDSYRWMRDEAWIAFAKDISILRLGMKPYVGLDNPEMKVRFNGEKIASGRVINQSFDVETLPEQRIDVLSFESSSCGIPARREPNSSDMRCLGYRLESPENISVFPGQVFPFEPFSRDEAGEEGLYFLR